MRTTMPPASGKEFDPDAEFKILLEEAAAARKRNFHPSKLDPYTHELLALRERGAAASHLQRWLRKAHKIEISLSGVNKWLAKHPPQTR